MNPTAPSTEPISCAIAGLGKMGIMHASMLSAIPGASIAGLIDLDVKNCKMIASMGVEAPAFQDLIECIEKAKPRAIWITTPQSTHRRLMEQCLERGVAVFVEKPLAHTVEDALAMAKLARHHADIPVGVGYMLGHNPLFAMARDLIDLGVLGQVKCFRASCRLSQVFSPKKGWTFTREGAGGGVLINSGVHLLYAMHLLFGRPRGVTARGGGVHNEVEDALGALIDYESGVWGQVEVNWSVPGYENQTTDIEVVGTAGTITMANEHLRLWLARKGAKHPAGWSEWRREDLEPRAAFIMSPDYCGDEFYLEDLDMIEAVREGRKPRVDADTAYEVQEALHAIYVSLRGGDYVDLPGGDEL